MQSNIGLVIIGVGVGYLMATIVYLMPVSKPDVMMDMQIANHCGWIPDELEYKQIWDNCVAETMVRNSK